jgi:hypothetical protein
MKHAVVNKPDITGTLLTSAVAVMDRFTAGEFRYQFIYPEGGENERSRVFNCSNEDEARWLSVRVSEGAHVVASIT